MRVTPFYERSGVVLHVGHVLDVLRSLPPDSVQCCVTSPPYFGLRAYGTEPQIWGGSDGCEHAWVAQDLVLDNNNGNASETAKLAFNAGTRYQRLETATCTRCSAWRGELGSEPTPALFVAHLVEIFAEVRRVLRSDGLCFVVIGDSYAGSGKGPTGHNGIGDQAERQGFTGNGGMHRKALESGAIGNAWVPAGAGTRQKSLLLIPERLAIALSDDGWIVRSRICWAKKSNMPESVRDRPTSAWEHIFMLSKSGRYYWDADAVREPHKSDWSERLCGSLAGTRQQEVAHAYAFDGSHRNNRHERPPAVFNPAGANLKNFWLLGPDPFPGSHFAVMPREIPRRCILAATQPGDVVLDPFAGSGTTLLVAKQLERRAIGIELNATYAHLATDRLTQDVLPLFAAGAAEGV